MAPQVISLIVVFKLFFFFFSLRTYLLLNYCWRPRGVGKTVFGINRDCPLSHILYIFFFGKTSNSTKIVCEIANSLQKKVVHQDSNLTQKFGLRRVFCFLAYQAGRVQGWLASAKFLAGRKPPQLGAPPPKGGGSP